MSRLNNFTRINRAKIGPTTALAYTGTSARTSALVSGYYRLSATTDCHIRQGTGSLTAVATDYPLYIGQEAWAQVNAETTSFYSAIDPFDGRDDVFAAIRNTMDGTLSITLVSRITAAAE